MNEYTAVTPELMAGFLDEAPEYLTMLDEGLLAFESKAGDGPVSLADPEDHKRMNEMFRAAHSLKGLAAAMGFTKIRDLTHLMETLFDHVRMGKRSLEARGIEALFAVFDRLRALVKELSEPPPEPVTIEDTLKLLEEILSSPAQAATAAPKPAAAPVAQEEVQPMPQSDPTPASPVAGATPAACDVPIMTAEDILGEMEGSATPVATPSAPVVPATPIAGKLVLDDPQLIQLFVETTAETIDELNQGLLKLESAPGDREVINEIFRCAHNIKGATGAAGCQDLYRLTHCMETALDRLRNDQVSLDDALMSALLKVVDQLRADIEQIRNGRYDDVGAAALTDVFTPWLGGAITPPAAAAPSSLTPASAAVTVSTRAESNESVATTNRDAVTPNRPAPAADDHEHHEEGGLLDVVITFPPDFIESEIQAYLIYNKLNELGHVELTEPDVDKLDGSTNLERILYRVNATGTGDQIASILLAYSVKSVDVIRVGSTPAAAPATPVTSVPAPTPAIAPVAPRVESAAPAAQSAPAPEAVSAVPPVTSVSTTAVKPVDSAAPGATTPPTAPTTKPTSTPVAKSAASSAGEAAKSAAPKVGETLRVDLERLDQLMNLGGELVINKARFMQIQGQLDPLFSGQNVGYLVDDVSDRIRKLGDEMAKLSPVVSDRRAVAEVSDALLHLTHDFETIRGIVQRVQSARGVMNDFGEALHSLNRISEGIQKRIMETRMVSIGPLFQRFRRVVRDIAKQTGKDVELVLHGEATELDKRMIDELGDPLTHMIRNSVDHGIESPEVREKAGKPRVAQVTLDAYHRGRHICIEVRDDGKGVNIEAVKRKIVEKELATQAQVDQMPDKEVIQYIFRPGFSTAEKVTDLSGRGMGMDIVMNKLESINGTVEVDSVPGKGTRVTIKLPLTLAIITSLVARIGKGVYAIPLEMVGEIITVSKKEIQSISKRRVVRVRDRVIPVAMFEQIFASQAPELQTATRDNNDLTLVILSFQHESIGLVVDEMIGQEDVVIKNLAANFRNVSGIAGASIMGDGSVSLILDVATMMAMFTERAARGGSPTSGEMNPADVARNTDVSTARTTQTPALAGAAGVV